MHGTETGQMETNESQKCATVERDLGTNFFVWIPASIQPFSGQVTFYVPRVEVCNPAGYPAQKYNCTMPEIETLDDEVMIFFIYTLSTYVLIFSTSLC